jgi:DnaK suppressor protein
VEDSNVSLYLLNGAGTYRLLEVQEVAAAKSSEIRTMLEGEKKRISEELNQIKRSHSMDDRREGSPFGKREEEATESMELEKRLVLENRLNLLLAEVERALKKLDDGTYGSCDVCNLPIDPARLQALPQAILCLSCRQKMKNVKPQPASG